VSRANLQAIAARAQQHDLDTAMLEWWSNGNGYRTLHEDLKIGNNSAWQDVALTWSRVSNPTRLYRNGAEVSYAVQDTGTGVPLDDTAYAFVIGARGALEPVTFFNGLLDEVRLYRRALSAEEIRSLYEAVGSARRR
jgi:hypothetical protein